ncbi:MAG: hypothetical protein JNK29_18280 [Anaerolineales bacterium]|nr:hypothetical protein [Anaerolineales bacterium]
MCVFCAAIPSALAVGAAVHGKQREAVRRAESEGRPAPKPPRVPAAKVTAVLVVTLVVASALYHTQAPA